MPRAKTVFSIPAVVEGYRTSSMHRSGYSLKRVAELATAESSLGLVVDLGGGSGHLGAALTKSAERIVLADSSIDMLLASRSALTKTRVVRLNCEAETIPIVSRRVDVVVSRLAFHHFNDVDGALREIARVLRYEGALVFADVCVPEDPAGSSLINEVQRLRDPSHRASRSVSEWLFLLESQEFVLEYLEYGYLDGPRSFREWAALTRTTAKNLREIVAVINQSQELSHYVLRIKGSVGVPRKDRDFLFQFPRIIVKARHKGKLN